MAHELDFTKDGKARMFYVSSEGLPWHGSGKGVSHVLTVQEALTESGADFPVSKRHLFLMNENDEAAIIPDHWAICRNDQPDGDNVLGVVKGRYIPIQNAEVFGLCDMLSGENAACFHTAGVLKGGRRVWVLMKLPDIIEVASGDNIDKYLLFTTSHDGTEAARLLFTPIRVVCQNTLSAAIGGRRGSRQGRVHHSGDIVAQFRNAAEVIGIATKVFDKSAEAYRALAGVQMGTANAKNYFNHLVPDNPKAKFNTRAQNVRAAMLHLFENGRGSELASARGTMWGCYNAVSEYVDHLRMSRSNPDNRMWSSWFGTGGGLRSRAFTEALASVR